MNVESWRSCNLDSRSYIVLNFWRFGAWLRRLGVSDLWRPGVPDFQLLGVHFRRSVVSDLRRLLFFRRVGVHSMQRYGVSNFQSLPLPSVRRCPLQAAICVPMMVRLPRWFWEKALCRLASPALMFLISVENEIPAFWWSVCRQTMPQAVVSFWEEEPRRVPNMKRTGVLGDLPLSKATQWISLDKIRRFSPHGSPSLASLGFIS